MSALEPNYLDVLFGATRPNEDDPAARLVRLRAARDAALRKRGWTFTALVVLGGLLLVGWSAGLLTLRVAATLAAPLAALTPVLCYQFSVRRIEEEIRELELESAVPAESDEEQRAYRLFKRHEFELRKYYDHTLRQSRLLAALGLACIAAGLVALGLAAHLVERVQGRWEATTAIAVLGAAGGLLSNYVAVVFLKMHATTAQALNDFHNRLVSTHHLHLANFFAAKIDDPARQEEALKAMAIELARH